MVSVPMPRDLSEEAVVCWIIELEREPGGTRRTLARAVRSLVEQKVREAVFAARDDADETYGHVNAIVSRVLGEEAPRG